MNREANTYKVVFPVGVTCAATLVQVVLHGRQGSWYPLSGIIHQPQLADPAFGYRLLLPMVARMLEYLVARATDHNAFIAIQILVITVILSLWCVDSPLSSRLQPSTGLSTGNRFVGADHELLDLLRSGDRGFLVGYTGNNRSDRLVEEEGSRWMATTRRSESAGQPVVTL